jgi:hypothetical protein
VQLAQTSSLNGVSVPVEHGRHSIMPLSGAVVPGAHAAGMRVGPAAQYFDGGQRDAAVAPAAFDQNPALVAEHSSSASAIVPATQSARCVVGALVGLAEALWRRLTRRRTRRRGGICIHLRGPSTKLSRKFLVARFVAQKSHP